LVAEQSGIGGAGLSGQLDQSLDVVAPVFLDNVVNLGHAVSSLDRRVMEGATPHRRARRR
jgi:tRNA G10  N-methylase Trm11